MFVERYPHPHHPVVNGEPDLDVTVEVFQHRPAETAALLAWAGGDEVMVNGGPAVVLPGTRPFTDRLVGLGDFVVRDGRTSGRRYPADGFHQRFRPAQQSGE